MTILTSPSSLPVQEAERSVRPVETFMYRDGRTLDVVAQENLAGDPSVVSASSASWLRLHASCFTISILRCFRTAAISDSVRLLSAWMRSLSSSEGSYRLG